MCGIVYSKSFNGRSVVPTIVERYKAQKHRGSSGFGFFLPATNRLTHNVKESRIISLLKRHTDGAEILFHHRFPTSTANVRNACHPFSTKDSFENNYILVHNGVLRNEHELKRIHEDAGINYVSKQENGRFNDSEALTYDVASYLEGISDSIKAEGSIAFVAIKRDKAGKPMTLFFARNSGNPLKMKRTKYSITLSSEGEGENIEANVLYSMSYDTLDIIKRDCIIKTGWQSYSRPSYTPSPAFSRVPATTPRTNIPYNDFDDDDELSGLGFTRDEDDDDYDVVYGSEVKNLKETYLYDANYDIGGTLVLVTQAIEKIQTHLFKMDYMLEDEKLRDTITDQDMNDYIGEEEQVRLLEDVVKSLKSDLIKEATKEVAVKRPIGFQPFTEAAPITTRVKHVVPTKVTTTSHKGDTK